MNSLLAFITSFFIALSLRPTPPPLIITPTITISPTSASTPVPNKVVTGTPITGVKFSVVDMKKLAEKQREINEYKKTDACYIQFVESKYKSCPPGCFFEKGFTAGGSEGAPVSLPKCGTRKDYLPYY